MYFIVDKLFLFLFGKYNINLNVFRQTKGQMAKKKTLSRVKPIPSPQGLFSVSISQGLWRGWGIIPTHKEWGI